MNKINPIFEALSGVDERHVPVTTKKRFSTKKKILIIVAAAAVFAMILGASRPRSSEYGLLRFQSGPGKNDITELQVTPQKFTLPEEFTPNEDWLYNGKLKTLDDVRETFGITPIINDNFTVGDQWETNYISYSIFGSDMPPYTVELWYYLYSKNCDDYITLSAWHYEDVNFHALGNVSGIGDVENVEIITLKDDSPCILNTIGAYFSWDGVFYMLDTYHGDPSSVSFDETKQILFDLGVYDPE